MECPAVQRGVYQTADAKVERSDYRRNLHEYLINVVCPPNGFVSAAGKGVVARRFSVFVAAIKAVKLMYRHIPVFRLRMHRLISCNAL